MIISCYNNCFNIFCFKGLLIHSLYHWLSCNICKRFTFKSF
ncbi:hypothetical protein MCHI_002394 [Candidatus Magnetoovum chiemensis]|nr:hypothetical protein MCHI_002394 [Candidatus Magnetoovum chiemensis]